MSFLERLQKAARYAGVGESQAEIAEALEITRQRVNSWFKGGGPNRQLTAKIARKWCVNLEWLATGNGDMLSPLLGSEFSPEEKALIKHYRSASPKVRQIISAMVRVAGE
jgi:transcriptional regulator with XRE-family HTH domain